LPNINRLNAGTGRTANRSWLLDKKFNPKWTNIYYFSTFTKNKIMITKENLIQAINKMPDKFSVDDIIEELVLLSKIEQGLADVESGRVHSEKQVEKKWPNS